MIRYMKLKNDLKRFCNAYNHELFNCKLLIYFYDTTNVITYKITVYTTYTTMYNDNSNNKDYMQKSTIMHAAICLGQASLRFL